MQTETGLVGAATVFLSPQPVSLFHVQPCMFYLCGSALSSLNLPYLLIMAPGYVAVPI